MMKISLRHHQTHKKKVDMGNSASGSDNDENEISFPPENYVCSACIDIDKRDYIKKSMTLEEMKNLYNLSGDFIDAKRLKNLKNQYK